MVHGEFKVVLFGATLVVCFSNYMHCICKGSINHSVIALLLFNAEFTQNPHESIDALVKSALHQFSLSCSILKWFVCFQRLRLTVDHVLRTLKQNRIQ